MIAAGTGFSPFRGFLQERKVLIQQHKKNNSNESIGKSFLFFGCRSPNHGFIYKDEIEELTKEGYLTNYFTAFSRHGDSSGSKVQVEEAKKKKMYVQERLWENRELVWQLFHQEKAIVYICGSANRMAKDVYATWVTIIQQVGKMSSKEAEVYLRQAEADRRYLEDIWN